MTATVSIAGKSVEICTSQLKLNKTNNVESVEGQLECPVTGCVRRFDRLCALVNHQKTHGVGASGQKLLGELITWRDKLGKTETGTCSVYTESLFAK